MDKFTDLLRLAAQLNSPEYHIFIDFSGHIETLFLEVCPGGWKKEGNPEEANHKYFCFDTDLTTQTTEEVITAACQWLQNHYESHKHQKAPA